MITLEELKCDANNIDIDKYINFIEVVKQDMQFPEWIGEVEKVDVEKALNNRTKIWLYFKEDTPICSMMLIPTTKEALNKFEIKLLPEEVVGYGPMFVDPNYTGNKLQLQMLRKLDEYSYYSGYKYALATVHPDNAYSIINMEDDGFKKKKSKVLNRGLRDIYIKKLD